MTSHQLKKHGSPKTVKRHAMTIYNKLNVHSRREAVAKAGELGILSEPHRSYNTGNATH